MLRYLFVLKYFNRIFRKIKGCKRTFTLDMLCACGENLVHPYAARVRAVFDEIEKTPRVLALLNDFNCEHPFFTAFVREDGFLELRHFVFLSDENAINEYPSEFLIRLANLADSETLLKLTRFTY